MKAEPETAADRRALLIEARQIATRVISIVEILEADLGLTDTGVHVEHVDAAGDAE